MSEPIIRRMSAGQLRDMGGVIPENIPDCAVGDVKVTVGVGEGQLPNQISMRIIHEPIAPFEWIEINLVVESPKPPETP